MDDIERQRAKLDNIPGYEPPLRYVYANKREGTYKTFNNKKNKQAFGTTTNTAKYGYYNNVKRNENCPICKRRYVCQDCPQKIDEECDCEPETYVCNKGHKWYTDINGFVNLGEKPSQYNPSLMRAIMDREST